MPSVYDKPFENIVGKGENAGNQHFLLSPLCFLSFPKTNFNFSVTFCLSSANAVSLDQSRILWFGKELTHCKILDLSISNRLEDDNYQGCLKVQSLECTVQ